MVYTEQSVKERYLTHKDGEFSQEECALQVTRNQLVLTGIPRLHGDGTNRGTHIGPILLESENNTNVWCLPPGEKKN